MKKEHFSLGILLASGIESNKYLINKYKDYITSIYIGPSLDLLSAEYTALSPYQTLLQQVYGKDIDKYEQDLLTICDYARNNDIEICLTANLNHLTFTKSKIGRLVSDNSKLETILNFLNKAKPELICTTLEALPWFKENYGGAFYIQTFFEGGPHIKEVQNHIWDSYVIKHKHMISDIVNDAENRLLINQSCPDICNGCFRKKTAVNHESFIDTEFIDIETYLAYHMWGREDINAMKQCYPDLKYCFKVSSRIRALNGLMDTDTPRIDRYLDSLINGSIKNLCTEELFPLACVYTGLIKNSNASKILANYDFTKLDYKNLKTENVLGGNKLKKTLYIILNEEIKYAEEILDWY